MANTRIAIKRSTNTQAPPATLFQGELCYTQNGSGAGGVTNSGLLYIGQPSDNTARAVGGILTMGVLSPNQIISTNSTSYVDKLLTANLTAANAFLTVLYANGIVGTTGNVLCTNSTGGVYWGTVAAGGVTITMGNGLTSTQSPLTTSGTMSVNVGPSLAFTSGSLIANLTATSGLAVGSGLTVLANSGIVANSTGTYVLANSGLVSNATGVFVLANSGHVSNSTGVFVIANSGLVSNATGVFVLANTGIVANSTGTFGIPLANSGMVSNSTGVFVNAGTNGGLVSNATGVWVAPGATIAVGATVTTNLAATPGLIGTSGLAVKPDTAISVGAGGTQVNLAASPSGLTIASGLGVVVNTAQLVLAAGGITHNAAGVVTLQDLTCSGNLTVSGTITTLDATNLSVKDNMIILADQWAVTNTYTQTGIDAGFYTTIGNNTVNAASGIARIAASSTNTVPYFKVFNLNPGNATPNSTVLPTSTTGMLESYLVPYGAGGAFVANATNFTVLGNSSLAVAITANTLTVTGGMAITSISNTGATDGYTLQSQNGTLAWGSLDGGTF